MRARRVDFMQSTQFGKPRFRNSRGTVSRVSSGRNTERFAFLGFFGLDRVRVDHHAATKSRAANAWPAVDRSKSSVLKGERLLAPDCDMAALTFTSTAPSRAATAATCASYEARAALVASAGEACGRRTGRR